MTSDQIFAAFLRGVITREQAIAALQKASNMTYGPDAATATIDAISNWPPEYQAQWLENHPNVEPMATVTATAPPAGSGYDTVGDDGRWFNSQTGTWEPMEDFAARREGENAALAVPPDTTGTREGALFEQEAKPESVFSQYLAGSPLYGRLSTLGREAMESQYQPQLQSFQATADNPLATFRDWLQQNKQALNPQTMQNRLGEIAGYFDIDPRLRTDPQSAMVERYASNPNALAAYLSPLMARVNPMFRGAVGNVAGDIYNRFMGTTPEQSFMQYMAKRGGFFGGI